MSEMKLATEALKKALSNPVGVERYKHNVSVQIKTKKANVAKFGGAK